MSNRSITPGSGRTQGNTTPNSRGDNLSPGSLLKRPSVKYSGKKRNSNASNEGLSAIRGIQRVQIASRSGAPEGHLDTIKEGDKTSDPSLLSPFMQDPDTPFFFKQKSLQNQG